MEDFLQEKISKPFLEQLDCLHEISDPHPKVAPVSAVLSAQFANGCNKLFLERLRPDIFSEGWRFIVQDYGNAFILTLKQKEQGVEIPLVHLKEKPTLKNLQKETPQFSKDTKKIFSQEVSFTGKTVIFENAYIFVSSKKSRRVKLITYQRPGQDQTLAECVKYSCELDLFNSGTQSLHMDSVHDFYRVLFNCAFLQLKSLDLINCFHVTAHDD